MDPCEHVEDIHEGFNFYGTLVSLAETMVYNGRAKVRVFMNVLENCQKTCRSFVCVNPPLFFLSLFICVIAKLGRANVSKSVLNQIADLKSLLI
jgi:hypothetical protein